MVLATPRLKFVSSRPPNQPVYSSEDRLYCYPNSDTLKNLLDIRDASNLAEVEAYIVGLRMAQVLGEQVTFTLDFAFLKYLHRRLFGDLYEWAGTTRQVDLSKGDTRFAVWERVESESENVFNEIAATPPLRTGTGRSWFLAAASHFLVEINVVHPFREGNGRTTRVFTELWAKSMGLRLAWNLVEPEEVIQAMIHGVANDANMLRSTMERCLVE